MFFLKASTRGPQAGLSGSADLASQVQDTEYEFREHHILQGKEGTLRQVFPDLGSREEQTEGGTTEPGGYRVKVGCVTLKSSHLGVNSGSLLISCGTLGERVLVA